MARATGDPEALDQAVRLFNDIESHAFDSKNNGYIEALTRDWQSIADMRLSNKDENGSRTMNSHLHILEPYTNLYHVWPDARLKDKIINLLHNFTGKFYNQQTHHLDLFFNDEWQGKRNIQSFGHDIEASWLMDEAADVIADKEVRTYIAPYVRTIADAADDGSQPDGSMIYERWLDMATDATADNKVLKADTQRQWWVQCESVVGHVNLFRHFGDKQALDKTQRCWEYIKSHLLAPEGEWYWSADEQGQPNTTDDRTGFWKCPYHNTRMCLETITMLS